ncbi:uncharacterized protein EI90DRAFT_3121840 [Cantharellus anzutake]|uniref:uncharacterized protein n=1 Tax=Cantharellus anzutake TaxID=1750568 RepID=UPI0019087253|nr:uncharacterized protein EI90DRAFT_3121840 [Cantharellus anzutake]KAF8333490.1 hypothetical protein EI90DRAFT_3121840 [Cantharellus anzutake]
MPLQRYHLVYGMPTRPLVIAVVPIRSLPWSGSPLKKLKKDTEIDEMLHRASYALESLARIAMLSVSITDLEVAYYNSFNHLVSEVFDSRATSYIQVNDGDSKGLHLGYKTMDLVDPEVSPTRHLYRRDSEPIICVIIAPLDVTEGGTNLESSISGVLSL